MGDAVAAVGVTSVVDFRARPNTPEWASYLARRRTLIDAQAGTAFEGFEAAEETLAGFVAQLDAAGIDRAVFAARSRASSEAEWPLTSDFVAECVRAYPARLLGFAGVDVSDPAAAVREARRAVTELHLSGVCFDPFTLGAPADDPRLDALYETCADLGVPAVITLGGWPGVAAPLRLASPLAVDAVAKRFPELLIVASHAGWPFTQEMIAVAWRCENVYFENSFYHFAPGAELVVEAANTMIGDKVLYASAYPFTPLGSTLERFRKLPFTAEVLEKVLHVNAERLLARIAGPAVS